MATNFETNIYILKGVPLDKDYNNTLYFANETDQWNTFYSFLKYHPARYSYQRENKNVLKVEILNDNLYDCNYIMFQNSNYSNKWFYAFIDRTEYINETTSAIYYTIDEMQTWYFDYDMGMCMVDREHTETDEIGDNVVAENFKTNEYVVNDFNNTNFNILLGAVMLKARPHSFFTDTGRSPNEPNLMFPLAEMQVNQSTYTQNFTGSVFLYTGFFLNYQDYQQIASTISQYYLNLPFYYDASTLQPSISLSNFYSLPIFINKIVTGQIKDNVTGYIFTEDDIIGIYTYPIQLANIHYRDDNAGSYPEGTAISDPIIINIPQMFRYKKAKNLAAYIPKNNKLFTFPYVKIEASANNGSKKEFAFENFAPNYIGHFYWRGTNIYTGAVTFYPFDYNNEYENYQDIGLTIDEFPNCIYNGNAFTRYWERNKERVMLSMFLTSMSVIPAAIATSTGAGAVAALPVIAGATIANTKLATDMMVLEKTPPETYGNVNTQNVQNAFKGQRFTLYSKTIWGEYAEIIDNYFTMYGYKINKLKIPNVKNANAALRPHWNYIKTTNCIIHPSAGKGLPQTSENIISSIYNKGVTFWMNANEVGDYSLNNSPV